MGPGLPTVSIGGGTGSKGCLPARKKPPSLRKQSPWVTPVYRNLYGQKSPRNGCCKTRGAEEESHPDCHRPPLLSCPLHPDASDSHPKRVKPERTMETVGTTFGSVSLTRVSVARLQVVRRREEGRRTGRVSVGWG